MAGTVISVLMLTAKLSGSIKKFFGAFPPPAAASPSSSPSEVDEELEKLSRTLARVQAVLVDAEERQIRDESVRLWLREVRGLAHDAEDVLDEFEFALLRHSVLSEEARARAGKAKQQLGAPVRPSPLEDPSFRRYLETRIRSIRERSGEIEAAKSDLRLREEDGVRRRVDAPQRPPAAARVDKSCAFGRDGDVDKVVGMLLASDSEDVGDDISVVSVLGVDGVGKTTLAQLVFHDERVASHFEVKAWVWVSQDFDVIRLTREIVESIAAESCDLDELNSLQEILGEHLRGKRLLLVLDDVWNESQSHWEAFRVSLLGAAEGSRILVTTTSAKVSRVSGAPPSQVHHLNGLSDDASWALFCHHAFGGHHPQTRPRIIETGRQICKKCRGFPQTLRTIGELLRTEADEEVWDEILASETWDGKALSTLQLGYQHLPVPMKQCFAYCAVLPKDYKFGKDQLVRMWVAQGFVQPTARKQVEEIAGEHFEELCHRSFFQNVSDYRDTRRRFMMNDLIYNLAQFVWEEEPCASDSDIEACRISRHHCHSTVICNKLEALAPCEQSYDPMALRTLILKCRPNDELHVLLLNHLLGCLRYVRVLDLSDNNIFELPDSIGELKHLRYLGLNGNKITRLPESIGGLHNLQTLELRHCYHLAGLPNSTRFLINLRHLDLHCSIRITMMPRGIGKLTTIQTLPLFVVGKEDGFAESSNCAGIVELEELNGLRGELHLSGLQNVIYGKFDARRASMMQKQHLEKLHLDWSGEDSEASDMAVERDQDVLQHLQPYTNLRELKISVYKGLKFPSWMGSDDLSKLGKVTLIGCRNCDNISPLGRLPVLKHLDLHKMDAVRCVGQEFFHTSEADQQQQLFPSLEVLGLHDMAGWEEWQCWPGGEPRFRRLRRLTIRNCHKLTSLSLHNLTALVWLELRGCGELACINCFGSCDLAGLREDHLPYLEKLEVLECPRLGIPPGEQLSSAICQLHVCKCPLQRQRKRCHAKTT